MNIEIKCDERVQAKKQKIRSGIFAAKIIPNCSKSGCCGQISGDAEQRIRQYGRRAHKTNNNNKSKNKSDVD